MKNRLVDDWPVDITLRARGGYLGIRCSNDPEARTQARELAPIPAPARWEILWLPADELERDLEACLRRVGAALIDLGGSDLNAE